VANPLDLAEHRHVNVQEAKENNERIGKTDLLVPGWVEEWDPVSNKVYYWNKETFETSWTKPIRKSPDALLREFNGLLQKRAQKGKSPLGYLEQELRRSFPCLYRVENPGGAYVVAKNSTAVVRHISHGKIIVCTSMDYWAEMGPVLAMPDGYVRLEDVSRFLALDKPVKDLKPAAAVSVAS
jgi:hypothetical protein